jgi:uncharacterized membrane protein
MSSKYEKPCSRVKFSDHSKSDLSSTWMVINQTQFVTGFGMVVCHPISGPLFKWSTKLDRFTQKKFFLTSYELVSTNVPFKNRTKMSRFQMMGHLVFAIQLLVWFSYIIRSRLVPFKNRTNITSFQMVGHLAFTIQLLVWFSYIIRSRLVPFKNRTNITGFQMVRYWDAQFQLKWTIQLPDKSGFSMVTLEAMIIGIVKPGWSSSSLFCPSWF